MVQIENGRDGKVAQRIAQFHPHAGIGGPAHQAQSHLRSLDEAIQSSFI